MPGLLAAAAPELALEPPEVATEGAPPTPPTLPAPLAELPAAGVPAAELPAAELPAAPPPADSVPPRPPLVPVAPALPALPPVPPSGKAPVPTENSMLTAGAEIS